MDKISFVIPCYKSEQTIEKVLDELLTTVGLLGYDYEIVLVNDASPDNTLKTIINYAQANSAIDMTIVDIAKNRGKHAALMAGFRECSGSIVVCLDDDGQSPMNHLGKLLEPLKNGYDVSVAKYGKKKESFSKRLGSGLNSWMAQVLLDKPRNLQFGNFFAMKRFVVKAIIKYQNPYPYVNGLYLQAAGKIANVEMEERARIAGTGGYNFIKSISLFFNGMTSFSEKPLRIVSLFGFISSFVGFLLLLVILIRKYIIGDISVVGYASQIATTLFMGGVILLSLGMIGEYLGRMYICINNVPQYVIRSIYKNTEETK